MLNFVAQITFLLLARNVGGPFLRYWVSEYDSWATSIAITRNAPLWAIGEDGPNNPSQPLTNFLQTIN